MMKNDGNLTVVKILWTQKLEEITCQISIISNRSMAMGVPSNSVSILTKDSERTVGTEPELLHFTVFNILSLMYSVIQKHGLNFCLFVNECGEDIYFVHTVYIFLRTIINKL